MQPSGQLTFFETAAAFRKWLKKNHRKEPELQVGYYKVGCGRQSMTWSQSVDEALCFGWIDGVRRSIDEKSYCIRFSPRKPGSIWSLINIKKAEDLISSGRMQDEGLASFKNRMEHRSGIYAYEKGPVVLSAKFEKIFRSNRKAWNYFQSLAPSYRNPATNWVMSAIQEDTSIKRLTALIADSAEGRNKWKDSYRKLKGP